MKRYLLPIMLFSPIAFGEIYLCGSESNYYSDKKCKQGEKQQVVELKSINSNVPLLSVEEFKNGYELFLNSKRIGHEQEWTIAQAIEHYRWYKKKNDSTSDAVAYYNSIKITLK